MSGCAKLLVAHIMSCCDADVIIIIVRHIDSNGDQALECMAFFTHR
jgi:hypothetical protein